jgi:small subunit ribosomal protein S1
VGTQRSQPGTRPPHRGQRPRGPRQGGPARGSSTPAAEGEPPAEAALAGEPERPRVKVPPPSRRERLTPELEQELRAVLGDDAMNQLLAAAPPAPIDEGLEVETRHRGTVVKVHGDNVFFTLGGRREGVASLRQFKEPPAPGAQMDVVVRGYNDEDDLYELGVPGASIEVQDWSDLVEGAVVEARITGANTGGLECMVGSIRGFIPASQIEVFRVEHYGEYYEKKLLCVVTEANKRRRNLVLSHRAVVEREREEQRKKFLEELDVGQVREGVVRSIRDFGAFVDLGGVDGLIHISQLSWDRVNDPHEVLQEGQKVRVKIEKINRETGKIGLSYRDLLDHPWTNIDQRFPVDSVVKGTVSRIAKFGAFVKLAAGVEGLIHISELAHHRVVQVSNVVKEGDEVDVRILSVDPEAQRIALSLKATQTLPQREEKTAEEAADEPPREMAVPKHQGPLKGGTDRPTGGETFGLKW